MKKQKILKEGVSLIVLVLTIVIMVILSGVIVISLNNTGMIDKANDTVKQTNLDEMKELASIGWAVSYSKGARTKEALTAGVHAYIDSSGISSVEKDKYIIDVTISGASVSIKPPATPTVTPIVTE